MLWPIAQIVQWSALMPQVKPWFLPSCIFAATYAVANYSMIHAELCYEIIKLCQSTQLASLQ